MGRRHREGKNDKSALVLLGHCEGYWLWNLLSGNATQRVLAILDISPLIPMERTVGQLTVRLLHR